MFKHLFYYHIKSSLRTKELLFWTLLFPVILGTLFHFAFSNILEGESFETIQIAAVLSDTQQAETFRTVLDSISENSPENHADSDSILFHVTYTDMKQAEKLMDDEKISGIIAFDTEPSYIAASNNSYAETVTKAFLDQYQQHSRTITSLMTASNGQADYQKISATLSAGSLIQEYSVSDAKPDLTLNYFYTLIAMACFFSASSGVHLIQILQADNSPLAARQNICPKSKLFLFFSKGLAALLIQFVLQLIVLAFLVFILKIDFGSHILLVLIATFVGILCGILIGTFISLIVRGSEMVKEGISTGMIMLGCFLSGMMDSGIKYTIAQNAPFLAKINPVSLLTDAYYSLYFYDSYDRFFENLTVLIIITLILFTITIFFVRRLNYDTL